MFPVGTGGKESASVGDCIRRKWQPTPAFLAWKISRTEEPGGLQRSLWGHKESDMTEHTHPMPEYECTTFL